MCEVLKHSKTNIRKITVKNCKTPIELKDVVKKADLLKLESAVLLIHNCSAINFTYEELYRIVEGMCTYNMKEELYENLYATVENYLQTKVCCLHAEDICFLDVLNVMWVLFCKNTKLINNIYLYLDRTIINDKSFKNSIWTMNLTLFKNNIILNKAVKTKLIDDIMALVATERDGQYINIVPLKSLISMLADLQIYDDIFEPVFLESTDVVYRTESALLICDIDVVSYLRYVERRIGEEEDRLKQYILHRTEPALMEIIRKRLLKDHLNEILKKAVNVLIDENKMNELSLLYDLLEKIQSGHAELEKHFGEFIVKRGVLIVQHPEKDKLMIQYLIDFKEKIDSIVNYSFRKNAKFLESVRNSFKYFINQRHNKPAELLAKYVDGVLKSKNPEEDMEEILDKVMVLFRFVQGKDIFEAFYKRDLAKRLLVGKSSSQDAENSMISKLKMECGSGFTAKLEGMFKDVRLSQDINSSFKLHLNNLKNNVNFEMNINILTSSYWPNFHVHSVNLPEEMVLYQSAFQKFYLNTYNGRKLQWQPNLGSCILKAKFDTASKELQVSLFQTVVLLLFNTYDQISYKEIEEATNVNPVELKRTLQSLACGKTRVVFKIPRGKEVDENDHFYLNKDFTDKLFRVKINQIQMKETIEEQKATEESVFHDRQFQIDAAIVRIMKQNKILGHNELISQLYNAFDLPIKAIDFKKRIEQLIEREYIERDKENGNMYKYVA